MSAKDLAYPGRDSDAALAETEAHLISLGQLYYKYVLGDPVDASRAFDGFAEFGRKRAPKLTFDMRARDSGPNLYSLVTSIPHFGAYRKAHPDATYTVLWCLSVNVGTKRVFLYSLRDDSDPLAVFPRLMHVQYPKGPSTSQELVHLFCAPV